MKRTLLSRGVRMCNERSGAAAVEFALLSAVLLLLVGGLLDYGYGFFVRLRLANASSAAAIYALSGGKNISSETALAFSQNVRSVAAQSVKLPSTAVIDVKLNGVSDSSQADDFFCASGPPLLLTPASSGKSSCGQNLTAGKFVTITITLPWTHFFPSLSSTLLPRKMTEICVVRLI